MDIYESKEYVRARKNYLFQALFEYLIILIVTGDFLSKLLVSLGASDAITGIVVSFVSLGFLMQMSLVFINDKIKNIKKTFLLITTPTQFMYALIFVIPLTPLSNTIKLVLVISVFLISYLIRVLGDPIMLRWGMSFVSPNKIAQYSAKKEIVSLIGGMVFPFLVGLVVDKYEANYKLLSGFMFIAGIMFILNILHIICVCGIKNDIKEKQPNKNGDFKEVMQHTLHNKKYRRIVVFTSLGQFGIYMTFGFVGTFKINELMMSLSLIQIINIIAYGIRAFVAVPLGKYTDKYGFTKGMEIGYFLTAVAFLMNVFCVKSSWWLIILFVVLYNVGESGFGASGFNIIFKCVPKDYIVPAVAMCQSIKGVCGFLASLIGGAILSYIQNNGNTILGISVHGLQVLSAFSFIIILCTILYNRVAVQKLFEEE